ncbi:hypothetical protein [Halalkalibacter nanhaiisediminis]|uniref:Uncharacterized protein n=1 Tax=Halalkalibacter nanhaiisediminis TaxID=688079 RepID=A0A562QD92_9BACI|nr:hypothetical protein [Halalkalibacter nanhaiisediminis]TWI54673.1 hypothetical protein IQ10_02897 [Halalkalibacter nanhaiisediminis]
MKDTEKKTEGVHQQTNEENENRSWTVDRHAGDSIDEHMVLEEANEHFAAKEISQALNNS